MGRVYGANLVFIQSKFRRNLCRAFWRVQDDLSFLQEPSGHVDHAEERRIQHSDESGVVDLTSSLYDVVTDSCESGYWGTESLRSKLRKCLYVFPLKKGGLSKQSTGRDDPLPGTPMPPYLVKQILVP